MSDKEADKFNSINLSSDSDQDVESCGGDLTIATPVKVCFHHTKSKPPRRSSRRRQPVVTHDIHNITPTSKKTSKVRKKRRIIPQQITFKWNGEEIKDSKFKGPCFCKSQITKCIKLTEEDRWAVFEHVKNLPIDWRQGYVTELVRRLPIRGKYSMKNPSRKRSWVMYFHLTKLCGTILPVCKLMFINTTGLSPNFIQKCLLKKEREGFQNIISNGLLSCDDDSNKQKFTSKTTYSDQCDRDPSLFCQFDDQNHPIIMTTQDCQAIKPQTSLAKHSGKRKSSDYAIDEGEFSMPDNCSDSVSDSCMNTSSTLSLDPDSNPNDEEEKQKLIEQVLERQNTLDDLSSRVDSVKVENLKLKSENQVLGQYIENLMAASSVFQSASPKAKKK